MQYAAIFFKVPPVKSANNFYLLVKLSLLSTKKLPTFNILFMEQKVGLPF